jgi:transposase-like protein
VTTRRNVKTGRPKKRPAEVREVIAHRYWTYQRNHPKRICHEHGISENTLKRYAREFR